MALMFISRPHTFDFWEVFAYTWRRRFLCTFYFFQHLTFSSIPSRACKLLQHLVLVLEPSPWGNWQGEDGLFRDDVWLDGERVIPRCLHRQEGKKGACDMVSEMGIQGWHLRGVEGTR